MDPPDGLENLSINLFKFEDTQTSLLMLKLGRQISKLIEGFLLSILW